MKYLISFSIMILALFVFIGNALAVGADAPAGKSVYASKCKTCHGADGKGNAALAKTLKVEFKDLASQEVQSKSDDELKKQITEGMGKMEPVKGLTEEQIANVIAFIRSLTKS